MYNSDKLYQEKYLKYKTKYLKLKNLVGGNPDVKFNILVITFNQGSKNEIDLNKLNSLIQNKIRYIKNKTTIFDSSGKCVFEGEPLDFIVISLQESYVGIGEKAFSIDLSKYNYKLRVDRSMKQGTLGSMYLFIYEYIGSTAIYSIYREKITVIPCKENKLKVPLFKGGIIAQFDISTKNSFDISPLTIVGSHLPSKPTKPEYRNICLDKIISKIDDKYKTNIIFTGDLNYRAITYDEALKINSQEEKLNYERKIFNKVKKMFDKGKQRKECHIQTSYKNQYTIQQPTTEQLAIQQFAKEHAIQQPTTEKPTAEQPTTEQPTIEQLAIHEHAIQQSAKDHHMILHPTEQLAKKRYAKILDPIITDSLKKDQLNRSLSKNKLELKESKIEFCPTCKLTKGHSDERNKTIHYDPERVPSWCDRVLYKGQFKPIEYNSINLSNNSDHLAVYQLLQFDSKPQHTDTVK